MNTFRLEILFLLAIIMFTSSCITNKNLDYISTSNNYPYYQEYNIEKVSIKDNDSILDEKFEPIDGSIKVPESPGLGLAYNLNKMRERSVDKPTKLVDPRK